MTGGDRNSTVALSIRGMTCGHCVASVRRALDAVPGAAVRSVAVGSAEVALDAATSPAALVAAVEELGYAASFAGGAAAVEAPACCAPSPASLSRAHRDVGR